MSRQEQQAATKALWGMADYSGLAALLDPAAATLVDATAPGPGDRVLDVAAGTGNVAVHAAARGAHVTACDIAPRMVQLGRERTGPAVTWIETDVEDLPLPDATVDIALSTFGVIFARRPEVALAQLRRVLVPGGRLGLTVWTADGYVAERARIIRDYVPADPHYPDTLSWGDPGTLERRLATGFTDVRIERRSIPWRFDSPQEMSTFYAAHSAAYVAATQAAGERADAMIAALERHAAPDGGPVRIDSEYLLVQAQARS